MKKWLVLLVGLLVFVVVGSAQALTTTWTWNQHTYIAVDTAYTWDVANKEVQNNGGGAWHLATITSDEEQAAMVTGMAGMSGEWWLGGYQDDGAATPSADWHWVTDEAWDYAYAKTKWQPGEPNDWNNTIEDHLGVWSNFGWNWNDEHGKANIVGYIMEISPVPEPATMMLFGLGLLGLAGVSRKKMS